MTRRQFCISSLVLLNEFNGQEPSSGWGQTPANVTPMRELRRLNAISSPGHSWWCAKKRRKDWLCFWFKQYWASGQRDLKLSRDTTPPPQLVQQPCGS